MADDRWLTDAGLLLPDETGGVARLDGSVVQRAAQVLDVEDAAMALTLRSLLRLHDVEQTAFDIRTNTWRLDLRTGVVKSVLSGAFTATILRALGADAVPVSILAAVAPLVFEVKQVEIQASDVLIQAQLHLTAPADARLLTDLYDSLPADMRGELTLSGFADVVERLMRARLVVAGPDGLRVRPPKAPRGFRLALSDPAVLPEVLLLTEPVSPEDRRQPGQGGAATATATARQPATASSAYHPRVFVSYAHDTPEHVKQVLDLCTLLVETGIDVRLDQWNLEQRGDWQLWATREIREADFVLVVASPRCRLVGDGDMADAENLGLQSEMRTLRDLHHREPGKWLRRILPVVLPGGSVDGIPLFLQPGNADRFRIGSFDSRGVEELLRLMTGQPAHRRPALGDIPVLPPNRG